MSNSNREDFNLASLICGVLGLNSYFILCKFREEVIDFDRYVQNGGLNRINTDEKFYNDYSLDEHMRNVGMLSANVALHMGLGRYDAALAAFCGCVHDQGKLSEPMHWLNRSFNNEENAAKHKHAKISASVLYRLLRLHGFKKEFWVGAAACIVSKHHTPWKITNAKYRLVCEILHFSDMYIALKEKRHSSKPCFSHQEAINILRGYNLKFAGRFMFASEILNAVEGCFEKDALAAAAPAENDLALITKSVTNPSGAVFAD